jgi:hypothetical protein
MGTHHWEQSMVSLLSKIAADIASSDDFIGKLIFTRSNCRILGYEYQ